jgi:hypothetical protein
LPRASATIRSRTRSSSRPGSTASSRARASVVAEPPDRQLREPGERLPVRLPAAGLADREHQGDRFRQEAARDERQHLRRGAVEPLRVVDEADERPLRGRVRQEAEHGQPHEEAVRRRPGAQGAQAERCRERLALGLRQARQTV